MKCPKCNRELTPSATKLLYIEDRGFIYDRFPYEKYLYEGQCSICKRKWEWEREYSFGSMKEMLLREKEENE